MEKITADDMMRIVRFLGNRFWVRHWFHWNAYREPALLAIQVLDSEQWVDGSIHYRSVQISDLLNRGWEWDAEAQLHVAERELTLDEIAQRLGPEHSGTKEVLQSLAKLGW